LEELSGLVVHETEGAWAFTPAEVSESTELPPAVDSVVSVTTIEGSS